MVKTEGFEPTTCSFEASCSDSVELRPLVEKSWQQAAAVGSWALTAYCCRRLPTDQTAIQLSNIKSKRSGYSGFPMNLRNRSKNVKTLPFYFRCSGSGNAAPAVLSNLLRTG